MDSQGAANHLTCIWLDAMLNRHHPLCALINLNLKTPTGPNGALLHHQHVHLVG